METLRFLMATTFYPPHHLGGDAVHVQYLARALAERGHEVHVEFAPAAHRLKVPGRGSELIAEDDGVRLHPIPSLFGRAQPAGAYLLGRSHSVTRFHKALTRSVDPDVLHLHNISLLGLGVLGHGPASAATLYTAHDYWVRCPRSDLFKNGRFPCEAPTCLRCALRSARPPQMWRYGRGGRGLPGLDCAIAPSRFMMNAIRPHLDCPVVHLPNFAPDPNPGGSIWPADGYYLLVGALEAHKGIRAAVGAVARRPKGPSLLIAGRGSYERHLRAVEKDSSGLVKLKGWMGTDELAGLYRGAMALVIPSLSYDNAPLAAIEAMSWGVPLLVSRRGGLEELTNAGESGRSFEPEPTHLADAMERFEEQRLQDRLRAGARRAYERNHRPRAYLESYLNLIRSVADYPLEEAREPDTAVDLPARGPEAPTVGR